MKIRLFRHATLLLCTKDIKILVDPMLSPVGSLPPIKNSANPRPNPLVDLQVTDEMLSADAILLTHTHRDHFDDEAARVIPRRLPVFCQPPDQKKLSDLGFSQLFPVENTCYWNGINITRTGGRHGTGLTGEMMGPVSGYVLETPGCPSVYIAGDTIWCREVEQTLDTFHPCITVVFAGAAQFKTGNPITMTAEDILQVCRHAADTEVVAVHMEALNHCPLTRSELSRFMEREGFLHRVRIPEDGEWMEFKQPSST